MGRSKGEYLCGKNAVPMSRIMRKHIISSPLPSLERWFSIFIWLASVSYACYAVLKASYEYEEELNTYYMSTGWKFLGRRKDKADFEWDFWSGYFCEGWPWLLGHTAISYVFRGTTGLSKKVAYICYCAVAISMVLGAAVFLLLLAHCLIIYLCGLTGSAVLTWCISICLVSTLNIEGILAYMQPLVPHSEETNRQFFLMIFTTAMCNLRYTSFALEMCWHRQNGMIVPEKEEKETKDFQKHEIQQSSSKRTSCVEQSSKSKHRSPENTTGNRHTRDYQDSTKNSSTDYNFDNAKSALSDQAVNELEYNVINMLLYVFYLPLFCTGPLLIYNKFSCQWQHGNTTWNKERVQSVVYSLLRVIFWATFCEVVLHYFYFSSLMGDTTLLEEMPLWSLAGVGYCQGQFFMVKYVVLFGLPACIASLDNIVTPKGPCCISTVYLYSDMWKYFDRGLYDFIKRYIYIPLGGSKQRFPGQLFASMCCFGFIFVWHGAEWDLFVWTLANFIGVTLESVGSHCVKSNIYTHLEDTYLGAAMAQRLRTLCTVPLFFCSILAIFTFFKGTTVGYIYLERLILSGGPVPILTVSVALYCCIQTSKEIDRMRRNRTKQD